MSTTSIATNSNVSTEEREPSSSADPFLFNRGRSKSLLKRRAHDAGNRPPTDALSAQHAKPLVARVGRRATTKLCADQPNPLLSIHKSLIAADQEEVFIASIDEQVPTVNAGDNPWVVTISINGSPVKFKIDTGADVTVISDTTYKALAKKTPLKPAKKSLTGPSSQPLDVCGLFTGTLQHRSCTSSEDIFVVNNLQMSLLGHPAIESLRLVSRVNTVADQRLPYMYPDLFQGLGKNPGKYHIQLKDDAQPFALSTLRRVALPLQPKVKSELQWMEQLGVISKVDEPTDWCAGIVVVPKQDGKVRICVDLTKLNESVRSERHILPSVDHTLAQLGGAKVFTKLDANSGFWQIELSKESALLTTFITPFGRFCFNRLPFGITSAPEYFQKRMSEILSGLEGVVCMVDDVDVLVHGRTQEEHDQRLDAALARISNAGVTLNAEKCEFSQGRVKFLGHIVDGTGIQPDPEKVQAIQAMKKPTNTSEVRRFLGMTNQLAKFGPSLAEKAKPLRDLLSKQNAWVWGESQQRAFQEIKQELYSAPILALYDPNLDTVVSADASSFGLGAVLMQKQPDASWRPVVYASRSLTPTGQRYAQIEKEALALTWACKRFAEYLLGKPFHLHTDHKPLVPILSSKSLDTLPARVQCFRMRLMPYQFSISHVPGKDLHIADTLSRAPTSQFTPFDDQFCHHVDNFVHLVTGSLSVTEERLQQISRLQDKDRCASS